MRRSSCLACSARCLAATAFLAGLIAWRVVGQSGPIAREEKRRSARFDGLGYFRLKRIDMHVEFGGDGGKTNLAVETGQGLVLAWLLLRGLRIGGRVLTHRTVSKNRKADKNSHRMPRGGRVFIQKGASRPQDRRKTTG
jgi:hypothetical protein